MLFVSLLMRQFIDVLIFTVLGVAMLFGPKPQYGLASLAFAGYRVWLILHRRRMHEIEHGKEPEDEVLNTHWSKLTRKMTEKKSKWE
jgi:hypothetical protein